MRKDWPVNLDNHLKTLVSADFFVVPTIRFQILYVFLVLAHERRRIVHFAVTAHPTAEWTAQQMREACTGTSGHSWTIIIGTVSTWHWRRILRSPARSSRWSLAGSSRYRCWVGCITDTSGAPPE